MNPLSPGLSYPGTDGSPSRPPTAEIAKVSAESEFEKCSFVQNRLFESDFDPMLKQLPKNGGQP